MPRLAVVRAHQAAVTSLTDLAIRALSQAWRSLDLSSQSSVRAGLRVVVPDLVSTYGGASATLGADWYDDLREDAGARGRFSAVMADLPDAGRTNALVNWATVPMDDGHRAERVARAQQATALQRTTGMDWEPATLSSYDLMDDNQALELALKRLSGGLQRIVADADRDTVELSGEMDPGEVRFARHASANACAFCALLATRGAVYHSEESALGVVGRGKDMSLAERRARASGNPLPRRGRRTAGGIKARGTRALGEKYHDHCHCIAVPVHEGDEYEPPEYVNEWEQAYIDASVNNSTKGKYGAIDLNTTLAEMRKTLSSK